MVPHVFVLPNHSGWIAGKRDDGAASIITTGDKCFLAFNNGRGGIDVISRLPFMPPKFLSVFGCTGNDAKCRQCRDRTLPFVIESNRRGIRNGIVPGTPDFFPGVFVES